MTDLRNPIVRVRKLGLGSDESRLVRDVEDVVDVNWRGHAADNRP